MFHQCRFVYNYCDLFVYYSLYCLCERQNMSKIRVDIKLNTSQQVATINIDYLMIDDDDDIYIYIKKSNEIRMLVYIKKKLVKKEQNGFFTTFLYIQINHKL